MTALYAFGSAVCVFAAASNFIDARKDTWRSIRVLSWVLFPTWLAMGVMLGVFAFKEAYP